MSESAKKKLVQLRINNFTIISSDSDKTPSSIVAENLKNSSRKRKPSSDAENVKSNKIGRVADSKENIASNDDEAVNIEENDEEVTEVASAKLSNVNETTPTSVSESSLHIKLPSCTKSKRKINMDLKPQKSIDEDDPDDSIVYLDEEEMRESKKTKKSVKKSEKKRKKKENLSGSIKSDVTSPDLPSDDKNCIELQSNKPCDEPVANTAAPSLKDEVSDKTEPSIEIKPKASPKEDIITSIPSNLSSPEAEDPDAIHDEIIEMLSDDSDHKDKTSHGNEDGLGRTPTSCKIDFMNLTPKQLARRQDQEARRLEKEAQRQKERDLKEQQRLKEKEVREEAKRKEKEEKEEARKREKDDRDRKRQAEQDKKDEEKRVKEEERKRVADQRDEEKRLKEEERKRQVESREEEKRRRDEAQKRKEVEAEMRKKQAAQAFSKFFVAKKKTDASMADDDTSKDSAESGESLVAIKSSFMPFQIRERMKVAPCVRLHIDKQQLKVLDESLKSVKPLKELYIEQLKSGLHKPGSSPKTWQSEDKDDDDVVAAIDELDGAGEDIQADEGKIKMKHRSKFLSFVENRRPAYHGTWRKTTNRITARRPLAQDSFFDYDVDSDDEWEEEEPGESLHGSDSEKEKDKSDEEDYEVDNDFFVPHGHLSDEEMQQMDDEVNEDNHPEAQKAKLKILQQEFAAEMKKKTEKIKPRLIGCMWMNGDEDEHGRSKSGNTEKKYHCSDIIWRILKAREMMTADEGVKLEDNLEPEIAEHEDDAEKVSALQKFHNRAKINEGSVKELMKLIHGNMNNKKFIIREFQAYRLKNFHKDADFQEFIVKSVDEKMMEISDYKTCPEEGSMFGKKCWLVKPEAMLEHYGEEKLKLPNEWTYILEKGVKEKKSRQPTNADAVNKKEDLPVPVPVPVAAKTEVPDETLKPVEKPQQPPPSTLNVVKKRVQLLMSVPRGQEISQSKKNNLISQYLKGSQVPTIIKPKVDDEVVVIEDDSNH